MSNVVMLPKRLPSQTTTPPRSHLRESDPAGVGLATLWGACPWSEEFSDYDRGNIHLYARLLHDESEGADEDDLVRTVFGLDPHRNRTGALGILHSHLKRARWVRDKLLPMLDW